MDSKEVRKLKLIARLAHVKSRTHKENANIVMRIERELRNL